MKHFETLCAVALVIGIAVAPAFAKDRKQENAVENAEERIESIDTKLLDPDLSAERRERLEDLKEATADKFDLDITPPPEPEPVVLFKDDFERPEDGPTGGPEGGNAWQVVDEGTAIGIADGELNLTEDGPGDAIAINYVEVGDANYESFTLSYELYADPLSQPGSTLEVSWSPDGVNYTPLVEHDLSNPNIQDASNPQILSWTVENNDYDYFAWKLDPSGTGVQVGEAYVDNVTVTAQPAPVTTEFLGY